MFCVARAKILIEDIRFIQYCADIDKKLRNGFDLKNFFEDAQYSLRKKEQDSQRDFSFYNPYDAVSENLYFDDSEEYDEDVEEEEDDCTDGNDSEDGEDEDEEDDEDELKFAQMREILANIDDNLSLIDWNDFVKFLEFTDSLSNSGFARYDYINYINFYHKDGTKYPEFSWMNYPDWEQEYYAKRFVQSKMIG